MVGEKDRRRSSSRPHVPLHLLVNRFDDDTLLLSIPFPNVNPASLVVPRRNGAKGSAAVLGT